MRERSRRLKDKLMHRATEAFTIAVQGSMNPAKAAADAEEIRGKYRGLPTDAIAELLVRRAARKTKWEGAANGLAVSGCEVVVAAPVPDPLHKALAGAAALTALVGDLAWTTRVQ